ncbi:MAG: FUSC family protein [Burkholderiales bacterium]|nr:FUSC family protein [Burkholderiales bacterium]
MRINLKKRIDYARFIQLSFVFSVGLAMYLFTTIPHNLWIFIAVLLMMSMIEPGLIIRQSINNGKGTIVGIVLFMPIIYFLQLNYRLIPIAFIIFGIATMIPTMKRYDLRVVFTTMMIFTSNAYNYTIPGAEGPIEIAINRLVCTMIGIIICVCGDYFLFRKFDYSRKVYAFLQYDLCNVLTQKVKMINEPDDIRLNHFLLIENIRDSFNSIYASINNSEDSLLQNFTTSREIKEKVREFHLKSWQLRKVVLAIYYARCHLKDDEAVTMHLNRFQNLMKEAKKNYVPWQ